MFDSLYNSSLIGKYYPFLLSYSSCFDQDSIRQTTMEVTSYTGIQPVLLLRDLDCVFLFFAFCFVIFAVILLRWKSYIFYDIHTFFRTPKRSNFIESNHNLSRVNHFLMPILIGMLSLFFYIYFNGGMSVSNKIHWLKTMLYFSGTFTLYYAIKFLLFDLLSYVFFSPSLRQMWKESYMANLVCLGILYLPIFLFAVYSNIYTSVFPILIIGLFAFFRFILIRKTFGIFLPNYVSILYLILYLCTAEIIPAILLVGGLSYIFYLV